MALQQLDGGLWKVVHVGFVAALEYGVSGVVKMLRKV